MSAFQRRSAASGGVQAEGVRPAPYRAPVPLLSTGVSALDDILCGGGVLSGTILAFVPCAGTANLPVAQLSAPLRGDEWRATHDEGAVAAAEAYTDLFLSYIAAQGIASRHTTVVIGEAADVFVSRLMAPADEATAQTDESTEATKADGAPRMKIAWRYEKAARSAPPQAPESCTMFDLSKRMQAATLRDAEQNERLYVASLDEDTPLGSAWAAIQGAAARCRAAAAAAATAAEPSAPPPVLRIIVRDFGSLAWNDEENAHQLVRFLVRLKALLRELAMPPPTATYAAIPCVAALSLSPLVLSQGAPCGTATAHRLLHAADAAIGLSSFAATPGLSAVFPEFTGALRVYKTPSMGTLSNLSLRASILRGMGTGGAGHRATDGGAGGGENNLAFKVKRKRLAIETLHLDTDGGVNERRTQPTEGALDVPAARARNAPSKIPPAAAPADSGRTAQTRTPGLGALDEVTPAAGDAAPDEPTPARAAPAPRLHTGLQALRQRGLGLARDRALYDL